jgi:hypothetical protein
VLTLADYPKVILFGGTVDSWFLEKGRLLKLIGDF